MNYVHKESKKQWTNHGMKSRAFVKTIFRLCFAPLGLPHHTTYKQNQRWKFSSFLKALIALFTLSYLFLHLTKKFVLLHSIMYIYTNKSVKSNLDRELKLSRFMRTTCPYTICISQTAKHIHWRSNYLFPSSWPIHSFIHPVIMVNVFW